MNTQCCYSLDGSNISNEQADGTYKLTVKSSDHKDSTGEYNVHLY
ncbi:MAG: hypothetical protein D8H99_25445 [Streptococcus sp.]|nr:MAG: hypothetical protein D8H99_25445 [Streptococcus sp.]